MSLIKDAFLGYCFNFDFPDGAIGAATVLISSDDDADRWSLGN